MELMTRPGVNLIVKAFLSIAINLLKVFLSIYIFGFDY